MCALFAATYPRRTSAIILFGGFARRLVAPDYPWGASIEQREAFLEEIERDWGGPVGLDIRAPSMVGDARVPRDVGPLPPVGREPRSCPRSDPDECRRSTSARSSRRSESRRWSSTGRAIEPFPSSPAGTLPSTSPRRHSSSCRVTTTCPGSATRTQSSERSSSSSPGRGAARRAIGSWRRSCSPTSSAPPPARPSWRTPPGEICWKRTTRGCAISWRATPGGRSVPPATVPGHLRRARPRRPLRPGPGRRRPTAWPGDPGGPPHRGDRALGQRRARPGHPHRCPDRGPRRGRRGARVEDRSRPRRRLGPDLPGPGHARPQGRTGRVAALCRGSRLRAAGRLGLWWSRILQVDRRRGVAKPGIARALGARDRGFESHRPDHLSPRWAGCFSAVLADASPLLARW